MSKKNVLAEYFRCPEQLISLETCPDPPSESGYFRLGDHLVLYGHLDNGAVSSTVTSQLTDAAPAIGRAGSTTLLPFDPAEVVENLRGEKYLSAPSRAPQEDR